MPLQGKFFFCSVPADKKTSGNPFIYREREIFMRLIMIEWSSHDVYDHRVSKLPQDGANCDRWKFAIWGKFLQMDGFIKYGQEFAKIIAGEYA